MQLRVIQTIEEAREIVPHWKRLAAGRPLVSPEWLLTWWRHFGDAQASRKDESLAIICVIDDAGAPILIAPWRLEKSRLHGRTLAFLGGGAVCTDYLTVVCDPTREIEAIEALAEFLCPEAWGEGREIEWDLLYLESMDPADSTSQNLIRALAERGALTHLQAETNCWRLELPKTWDEYLATLSKSHRKRVRRLEREYFDSGRAVWRKATDASSFDRGFGILTDLHARRWASQGEAGIFDDPVTAQFHREAMRQLLANDQLYLTWLELDGHPVAADYSLVGNGVVYAYQSGMEPNAAEHEPGNLSLIGLLRNAIADGRSAVDFLRGDEPYKAHWRAEPRPTQFWRVLPNSWHSHVKHTLWQAGLNAKNLLRVGRDVVLSEE